MATVSYGDYIFTPSPNVTIQRDVFKTANNSKVIGGLYRVTLAGTRISGAGDIAATGIQSGHSPGVATTGGFWTYLNKDYRLFQATFEDCGTQIMGRPVVESISRSSDNFWASTNTYDIELVFAGSHISGIEDYIGHGLNLESLSTSYSHSYVNKPFKFGAEISEAIVQVDRGISVKGISVGSGNDYEGADVGALLLDIDSSGLSSTAFDNAVNYVTGVLGAQGTGFQIPSMTNIILEVPASTEAFLVERAVDGSPEEGTLNVNDTYYLFPVGNSSNRPAGHAASDTFTLSSEFSSDNGVGTVSLQGDIKGYPSYYNDGVLKPTTDKTAFESASGYFADAIDQGIFGTRAETMFSGTLGSNISGKASTTLNTGNPRSISYSYNIEEGSVNYSLSYDNSPSHCVIGVLSETISTSKQAGVPVVAQHTVLGRAAGPIMQDIGTKTASTWDLNIEAVVVPPNGCTAASAFSHTPSYATVVAGVESALAGASFTYFKTADSESFDVKTGRYTRAVSWIYTECN